MKYFLLFSILFSCAPKQKGSDAELITIRESIKAIKAFDTTRLFTILDTGYIFELYGREVAMKNFKYIHERFSGCDTAIRPGDVLKKRLGQFSTSYEIPFCRDQKGEPGDGDFDLVFTFLDGQAGVLSIEVKKIRTGIPPATIPVGKE